MKTPKKTVLNSDFSKDYFEILKSEKDLITVEQQWVKKGDFIQKFSLYENYTPVKTSSSTTLISEI